MRDSKIFLLYIYNLIIIQYEIYKNKYIKINNKISPKLCVFFLFRNIKSGSRNFQMRKTEFMILQIVYDIILIQLASLNPVSYRIFNIAYWKYLSRFPSKDRHSSRESAKIKAKNSKAPNAYTKNAWLKFPALRSQFHRWTRRRMKPTFMKLNKQQCLLPLQDGRDKKDPRSVGSHFLFAPRCAAAMALCNSRFLVGRIVAPFA